MDDIITKTLRLKLTGLRVKEPDVSRNYWLSDELRSLAPIEMSTDVFRLEFDCQPGHGGPGGCRAYFTNKTWSTRKHGLIYTSPTWIADFREALGAKLGLTLTGADVAYSEQGMQGHTYVHMDVTGGLFEHIFPDVVRYDSSEDDETAA